MDPDELARAFGIEPYRDPASNITAIPQPPQKSMATFSKANAHRYLETLKPHVGQWLVLYGGGGMTSHIVRLKKVEMKPVQYYCMPADPKEYFSQYGTWPIPSNWPKKELHGYLVPPEVNELHKDEFGKTIYYLPDNWVVEATLKPAPNDPRNSVFDKGYFEPHLGSWRLGTF